MSLLNRLCDRCSTQPSTLVGSYFNEDMLCKTCLEKEVNHPLYEEAKRKEIEEVFKGNLNFKGIGLPDDLK
jgi:hypothetical protein